jgi:hypothetical protein|tara:strand:- start:32 stop:895 length:864 start_codon:yes stop_codon:yes gene_type:complete
MISIDFVPGSHGHFLEFVCNKYISGHDVSFTPFNNLGASHNKFSNEEYNKNKLFVANHYSQYNETLSDRVIRITFDHDDLLLLTAGTFLRAGNANIHLNNLQENTYHTLANSEFFSYLIDSLNTAYPDLNLSAENPNCPRYIIREFFKFGFMRPEENGLVLALRKLTYPLATNYIDFPYKNFYNKQLFYEGVKQISSWLGKPCGLQSDDTIWLDFFNQQVFRYYKQTCNAVINHVSKKQSMSIPCLGLLQESYIDGILESTYGVEMPFNNVDYFKSTAEIIDHLCLK